MEGVTLDELNKLLEDSIEIEKPSKKDTLHSSISKFIKDTGITSGEQRVPNYFIYMKYREVTNHKQPRKPIGFFREFSKLFEQTRTGAQRYYLINESFDTSKEALKRAQAAYNKHHVQRKVK